MTDDDAREYEAQVREAQRMADNSLNESDKAKLAADRAKMAPDSADYRKGETPQQDRSGWPAPGDENSRASHEGQSAGYEPARL